MRIFKKAVTSFLIIALLFSSISTVVIAPYVKSENDSKLRAELSGSIDCIVIGASHALNGIDTHVLDEQLSVCSYNLSSSMLSMENKFYLLSKELERNPVKTVILELSYNSLSREEDSEFSLGDKNVINRLDSFSEVFQYCRKHVSVDDMMNLYSRNFVSGVIYQKNKFFDISETEKEQSSKGYQALKPVNLNNVNLETAENEISLDFNQENIKGFIKLIELCKSHQCRVIITVTVLSNRLIQHYTNWEGFHVWLKTFAQKNEVELYDINLIKNRTTFFHDETSFYNDHHLSFEGAKKNTELLCEVVNEAQKKKDISSYFYPNYDEMKKQEFVVFQ